MERGGHISTLFLLLGFYQLSSFFLSTPSWPTASGRVARIGRWAGRYRARLRISELIFVISLKMPCARVQPRRRRSKATRHADAIAHADDAEMGYIIIASGVSA